MSIIQFKPKVKTSLGEDLEILDFVIDLLEDHVERHFKHTMAKCPFAYLEAYEAVLFGGYTAVIRAIRQRIIDKQTDIRARTSRLVITPDLRGHFNEVSHGKCETFFLRKVSFMIESVVYTLSFILNGEQPELLGISVNTIDPWIIARDMLIEGALSEEERGSEKYSQLFYSDRIANRYNNLFNR